MACVYEHDFFVSYPHADDQTLLTEFVDALVKQLLFLRNNSPPPKPIYVDKERLKPGFVFDNELSRALCHSRAMLVVYTDQYFTRPYCQAEWNAMVELERKRVPGTTRSMIIPVLLRARNDVNGKPDLPASMAGLMYADFRRINSPRAQLSGVRWRTRLQELLDRIDDLKQRSADPAIDCDSFSILLPTTVATGPVTPFGGRWS